MNTALNLRRCCLLLLAAIAVAAAPRAWATQTEHLGIEVLPAPGPVVIDGRSGDWDLSGGVFACDDVETQRDQFAVWLHLMYDRDNLYVLARFSDPTPMNNPGQTIADYGFAGDSLQLRLVVAPGTPHERVSHLTAWHGVDQRDVVNIEFGKKFDEGKLKDAKSEGAQQAFLVDADGKGYAQELALPWKLIAKDGYAPTAGERMVVTMEPNFTVGTKGRFSVKDIFKPGITPDRVFTFMASDKWGPGTFLAAGKLAPHPVRLADGREFPVTMRGGVPVVDWTGVVRNRVIAGFKDIAFTMPTDGYVSLNVSSADGHVVRQLLDAAFYTKGEQHVAWDGLTTPNWKTPGDPVPAGDYAWSALMHTGIGLRLRGWACNAGRAPWAGASDKDDWGGDEGTPVACASDQDRVYLGWSGAEAGKALLAVDRNGAVQWKNSRQGMSGASLVAVDHGLVYAVNYGEHGSNYIYRVKAENGSYVAFPGSDSPDLHPEALWAQPASGTPNGKAPDHLDGLAAGDGKLYLAFTAANAVLVVDGATGKTLRKLDVPAPQSLATASGGPLYVVSAHHEILAIDLASGASRPFVTGLADAHGVAVGKDGRVYVGLRGADQQVHVYGADGKRLATIGRPGGRPLLGPWHADGMAFPAGLAIDADGKLWVAEDDDKPKRISVWNAASGAFEREFFGPTSYGALGGAIDPVDPGLVAGQGCEWRIDAKDGHATCLGVITRDGMENARFATGSNGKLYLAVATNWNYHTGPLRFYERRGDADYALRASITYADAAGQEFPGNVDGGKARKTILWSDRNGDGQRQPDEVTSVDGEVRFSAWYMDVAPDLTLYSGDRQFRCTGFTACGAPTWDLAKPVKMPAAGWGAADGSRVLTVGDYGVDCSWYRAFDIASGKLLWTYPDNFVGVHGSHNACPPEPGMIRGSYGPCASVTLPAPIGVAWIIPTNVGEWHILTQDGFYLTRLFQGDPLKVRWPESATPGAILDNAPPGMGGEDFGGSATLGRDGKLYIQAGKTAFWDLEVTGLETVAALPGGKLAMSEADLALAKHFQDGYRNAAGAAKRLEIKRASPTFTGDLAKDFAAAQRAAFQKSDDSKVGAALAWDDTTLYAGWEVADRTPWVNGASDAAQLYLGGDTVDLQLGCDPKAARDRGEAVAGDLRVSIGNLKGAATAVLYRKVSARKQPRIFSSGVIKAYAMDDVEVLGAARIVVTPRGDGYTVEAALPLAALELKPAAELAIRGDLGVTYGDAAGSRTRLRSYWSNQHTGLVDDAVFELQMEPKHWGDLVFKP